MKKIIFLALVSASLFTSCSKNQSEVLEATKPKVEANFVALSDGGQYNELTTVRFKNTSVNAVSYTWDFGNGFVYTDKEPIFTNPGCGTYHITLTAKDAKGNTSITSQDVAIHCIFSTGIHPAPVPFVIL